ncbi:MAG: hypothetical protein LBT05_11340 [Planctomycetaceae bacterium]|jgi:hypothetical protein|nr:hypothetical protein [Planctomycetaceae bacterium]
MHELVYTSAPRGLKPGSQGFCTVACTAGIPPNLTTRLEALSGYRHLFPPHESQSVINPIAYSHLIQNIGGVEWHILSRIADAGLDYTQRVNKLAHHIALEPHELPAAGPAAFFLQTQLFLQHWNDNPMTIATPRTFPNIESSPRVCTSWKEVTDDAGWGGALAETAKDGRSVALIVSPEMNPLSLFEESLALLPPEQRWQVTWTTYYMRFPSGVSCRWKCLIADSSAPPPIAAASDMLIMDLTQSMRKPVPTALVKLARIGAPPRKVPLVAAPPAAKNPVVVPIPDVSASSSSRKPIEETGIALVAEQRRNVENKNISSETVSSQPKPKRKWNDGKVEKKGEKAEKYAELSTEENESNNTRGLLALIGLGLLFLIAPIITILVLLSYRGEKATSKKKRTGVP